MTDPQNEEVAWALHRLVLAAAALDITLARRLQLGPSEYQAMKHLMTSERPLGPVELGTLVGLTSGSATTLVDRLERAGHLARHPDPGDRRRLTLEPTPQALNNAQLQLEPLQSALNGVLTSYNDQEKSAIARFLQDAVRAYETFNSEGQ
jgi:DNA-binding MarR family transcriptional regulator